MSWDIFIFNFNGPLPAEETMLVKGFAPPPLGEASAVRACLSQSVPAIDWTNPEWGIYKFDGLLMEFSVSNDGLVPSLGLHVYGSGDPLTVIQKICTDHNWYAFDTSSGWLDQEHPSDEGWRGFQQYRDKVKEKYCEDGQINDKQ